MAAVGLAGWHRLAPLRRGAAAGPPSPVPERSSPATWLAAAAGAAALGVAIAAGGRPGWVRWLLGTWAAFVLVTGIAGRVSAVLVTDGEVVVRRGLLPARVAAFGEVRGVAPPRWPLGAWRIDGARGSITLMPSDLRGAEGALAAVVLGAGLCFRDGAWRRPGSG